MKYIVTIAAILITFMVGPELSAEPSPDATKILEFYRTEDFLANAMPCMEQHLTKLSKELKLSAAQQKKIQGLIKRIYPAPNLYKIFKDSFSTNYSADKIAWKAKFINSVQGIKLRQAYASAFGAGAGTRQSFFEKNSAQLLTANRKNALLTFITATEQDRASAQMESRCFLGIKLAHNGFLGAKQRSSIRQLKEATEKREPSYIEGARKRYEIFDFFLLKDHKMNEVDELSAFYSSADGQAFTKAFKKTLVSTMEMAANTLYSQVQAPAPKK